MTLLDSVASDLDGSTPPSDAALMHAVRAGDRNAYGVLYERHLVAARAQARQLTRSPADADDLVSEAFAKVFTILQAGHGPDQAFRAYLLTTVRNCLYQRIRRDRRLELSADVAQHDQGVPWTDPVETELNSSLAARAFSTLPQRWQTVLWQSEVEQQSMVEIGQRLGLRPNAVAALAYRAREGLRQAYLQAHVTELPDQHCRPAVRRLGGWTRGRLAPGDTALVREHLDACARCRELAAELADVNGGIRGLLAPLAVAGATACYASSAVGITSLGVVAGAAAGGGALPTAAAGGGASTGSMIGSALGWLLGTHVGQATAAALTAAVVGGTAVAAGPGVVGAGGQGSVPASTAPVHRAAVHTTTALDTAKRPVGPKSGSGSKGDRAAGKTSPRKQPKDKQAPAKGVGKASSGKPSEDGQPSAAAGKASNGKPAPDDQTPPAAAVDDPPNGSQAEDKPATTEDRNSTGEQAEDKSRSTRGTKRSSNATG